MTDTLTTTAVGIGKMVHCDFATAVERAEAELKAEGFGILTRIDVRATLHEKLGVDVPAYLILGACNPPFAHRALEIEPQVGLLMPCNVVIRLDAAGRVHVEAANPTLLAQTFPDKPLLPVAVEITQRLRRVIERV